MNKKEKNDFLNRNEGFVLQSQKNRSGWDANVGENYSEYFIQGRQFKDDIDLLRFGYNLVCQMLSVLTPEKVMVRVDDSSSSYTNGKVINVATEVFNHQSMKPAAKLDIFTGLAIHEGCHCIYTDFRANDDNELIDSLCNIVEDERIEMNCGLDNPGLVNFLKKTKYYYFCQKLNEIPSQQKADEQLDEVSKAVNAVIKLIRFPSTLTDDEKQDFKELLDGTVKILLSYGKKSERLKGYPQSTKESLDAARKIFELLKKYIKDQAQPQKKNNSDKDDDEQHEDSSSNDSQSQENKSDDGSSQDDSSEKKNPLEGLTSKQIEQLLQAAGKLANKLGTAPQRQNVPENQQMNRNPNMKNLSLTDLMNSIVDTTGGKIPAIVYANKISSYTAKQHYKNIVAEIKHYIPVMRRSIVANNTAFRCDLRSQKSGHFDHSKIVQGYLGSETLYKKFREIKGGNANIAILVDMSGSMYGEKIDRARALATLMQESYDGVSNVNLFIYGHNSEALYVYNEGKKSNSIGAMEADNGNYDSEAINIVRKRVRQHTSEKVTFFVLSDGHPCEHQSITQRAVEDCIKDNFEVIAVGIDFNPSCSIYKHVITYNDMNTFVPQFCNMVKKIIEKATRR